MKLLTNADLYAPAAMGRRHLLVAGERIVWIGTDLVDMPPTLGVETIDLQGQRVIPGLVDLHLHLTGGGGESGFASRVPALALTQLTTGAVTTAVGLLGTDDVVRTPGELLAAARGLRECGLTTYCWTGGYHVPPATLTGSVRGDIVHIDLFIGAGEIAISDHRSSQPTLDELLRLASEVHVAGLMTGKAGVLHLHLGDGARGLALVREALDTAEIPARVYHPTHVNRRAALFEEALALTERGCVIDVTAFPVDEHTGADEVPAADAVARYLEAGLPSERITVSSDGGGCLPTFDAEGRITHMDVGRPSLLMETLRELLGRGVPLERALLPFTANPALLLRLPAKGHLAVGADADLAVLDADGGVRDLMARGRFLVRDGEPLARGPFE